MRYTRHPIPARYLDSLTPLFITSFVACVKLSRVPGGLPKSTSSDDLISLMVACPFHHQGDVAKLFLRALCTAALSTLHTQQP